MADIDQELEDARVAVNTMLTEIETVVGKGVLYEIFKYVGKYLLYLHGRVRAQQKEIDALHETMKRLRWGE